jgi:hypothetical protein
MNEFWGYPGADLLSVLVIGGISAVCLVCAWIFVKNY